MNKVYNTFDNLFVIVTNTFILKHLTKKSNKFNVKI